MGKKSTHWIGSIISIFLLGIVLFLLIYFFAPDMSLKFFGIAFGEEERVSTALEELIVEKFNVPPEKADEYLNSEKGQILLDSVMETTKKGINSISDIISSEKIQEIKDDIVNQDATSEGSV